ncbi:hypothetical protein V8J88_14405 [Massilia sp. W12]|uniref:hypothetical protein n=1 Tax=Massilia sp. W12 TaxID=3126507 RepID=UPI0030D05739
MMADSLFALITRTLCLALPLALSAPALAAPTEKPAVSQKKTSKKAGKKTAAPATSENEAAPDVQGAQGVDYHCEHGASLTLYQYVNDEQRAALRWKNRLLSMKRITTSTGAARFENTQAGLVWIGIPAKGILLDAKKGQQLANECKSREQVLEARQQAAPAPVNSAAAPAQPAAAAAPAATEQAGAPAAPAAPAQPTATAAQPAV